MTTIIDWDSTPLTNCDALSLRLGNYWIKGASGSESTIDTSSAIPTSSTVPTTVKIYGIVQVSPRNNPGGQYYTLNPSSVGYKQFIAPGTGAMVYTSLTCTITTRVCLLAFNLWTNCLKWIALVPDTNKFLYSYLDIIYRYAPSKNGGIIGNGPSTTIRLVKLFPEPQAMQDVQKKVTTGSPGKPFVFHYAHVTPESSAAYTGYGSLCLVEILKAYITVLGTDNSNILAIFLFNIPLIDTDVMDAGSTYPIGSLDTGISAWGLNSAPSYSKLGPMGCRNTSWDQ